MSAQRNPALAGFTFEELHAECEARSAVLDDIPVAVLRRALAQRGDETVTTVRSIGELLGYSDPSIVKWAKRTFDPLPVWFDGNGRMCGTKSALVAWHGRRNSKITTHAKRARSEAGEGIESSEKRRRRRPDVVGRQDLSTPVTETYQPQKINTRAKGVSTGKKQSASKLHGVKRQGVKGRKQ